MKLLPLSGIISMVLPVVAYAAPVQWTVTSGGNGHWYEAVYAPGGISWTSANAAAPTVLPDGYLASIHSEAENAFVFSLINDPKYWWTAQPGQGGSFGPWLGGADTREEGNWEWTSGEPWTYSNWFPGQPDNWMGVEHRLHYYWNAAPALGSTWNDLDNTPYPPVTGIYGYVVESAVPEPATLSLLAFAGLMAYRRRN